MLGSYSASPGLTVRHGLSHVPHKSSISCQGRRSARASIDIQLFSGFLTADLDKLDPFFANNLIELIQSQRQELLEVLEFFV